MNLNDIKLTYYEYVPNIAAGSEQIATLLRTGKYDDAVQAIVDFTEGFEWIIQVEQLLSSNGYHINARTVEGIPFFKDINEALAVQDYTLVADLFEYEIKELFSSASEWIFTK